MEFLTGLNALNGLNALTLLFAALCVFAIGYRLYGVFLAGRVLRLDDARPTPAVTRADGLDYAPEPRTALFGRHFASIAAAGPLLGPVVAAQFGFLPGALWVLIGCVLAGAVHDLVVLFASVRHNGQSLTGIARAEVGPGTALITSFSIFLVLALALAAFALACANALHNAPWSLFVVISSLPVAVLMGFVMRRGGLLAAGLVGAGLLAAALVFGHSLMQPDALGWMFDWNLEALNLALPLYGFLASLLPGWLLLAPRDYLAAGMKIAFLLLLVAGIALVRPELQMPALSGFALSLPGSGQIVNQTLPFIFITISCGAVSGWHAVATGAATPKMIGRERDILFVGYGAMLLEGLVAVLALAAACTLLPGDYFAVSMPPEAYQTLLAAGLTTDPALASGLTPNLAPANLAHFSDQIGQDLTGRCGGAASLALGMACIFDQIPQLGQLMGYWYNLSLLFMAVFILTAIDSGTRVGRFFLQELFSQVAPAFGNKEWKPGLVFSGALFTVAWGYLACTGKSGEIWPLFGLSNQLLASCALLSGATLLLRLKRGRLALFAAIPGLALAAVTLWAGGLLVAQNYLPGGQYLLAGLGGVIMAFMACVLVGVFRKWAGLAGLVAGSLAGSENATAEE